MAARSSTEVRLRVLGKFALTVGGQDIVLPGLKTRALLAFLACSAEKAPSRDRLIGLLWGERFEAQARQSLRHALSTLRKLLGPRALEADRDLVRLGPACWSDVAQFHALISAGERSSLLAAIELYQDELLSGFTLREAGLAEWLAMERARLREIAIGALETLVEGSEASRTAGDTVRFARRILTLDPYRERAHRQLLHAFAATGHRNEALTHYRQLERRLQEDLGVQPELETRRVFEALRSGATAEARLADGGKTAGSPVAGKPAIAVLPFDNLGEDAATARLADGVTEDIITDLARFRGLDVIARNSAAAYKGRCVDHRQIGRELNVHYALQGSIQRQAGQIRVTAQLVDTATGGALWSDRWDRPDTDIFAIQTEVAEAVAATLGGMAGSAAITAEETRKARRRPPASLTAYDYYLLANEGRSRFTRESVLAGIDAATRAIALDATLGRAYVARAWLNYIASHYGTDMEVAKLAMESDARRAVELDPHDAEARAALAFLLSVRGRFDEYEAQIRAALQANPTNTQVLVVAAAMQAGYGKPAEAAELADKVMRLDPWMTAENLNCIKDAYFFARRFEDVIAVVSRIPQNARGLGARLMLALSYALLGRVPETRRACAELLAHYPLVSADRLLEQDWVFARTEEKDLILDGFRAAQLPLRAAPAKRPTSSSASATPNRRRSAAPGS